MYKDDKGRFTKSKFLQKKQTTLKKNDKILQDKDVPKSTHQAKVDELMINNRALRQALKLSYRTIYHQNKVILNLEKKLVSQVPEILKSKLQIIGNALKEICLIVDETTKLLDSNAVTSLISEEEVRNLRSSLSIITSDVAENYKTIFKKKKKSNKKKSHKANLTDIQSLINECPELLEELNISEEEFPEPPCLSHYDIEEPEILLASDTCAEIIEHPEFDEVYTFTSNKNIKEKKSNKTNNKMTVKNNASLNTNNKSKKKVNLNCANKIKSKAKKQLNKSTKQISNSKAPSSFQTNSIILEPQAISKTCESLQKPFIDLPQNSSSNTKSKKSVKSSNINNLLTTDNHIAASINVKKLPARKTIPKSSKTVKKPTKKRNLKVKCLSPKLQETEKSDAMSPPSRRARVPVNYSFLDSSDSESEVYQRLPLKKVKQESKDESFTTPMKKKILVPPLIDLTIQPKVLLRDIFAESQIEINPLFKKALEEFNKVNLNNEVNSSNGINSNNETNPHEGTLHNEVNNNKGCSNINALSENNDLPPLFPIEVNSCENIPLLKDLITDRKEQNMSSFQETFDGIHLATQAFIDSLDAENDTYIIP